MKSPKKITLARIASHDFNRALRIWKSRLSDIDILRSLVNERAHALSNSLRSFGIAMVGTLWLSTAKSTLALKFVFVDLTIPAAYVNFVVAAAVFGTAVHAINYSMLNEFVRVASLKLFKFDAPWVLTVLQDGGSAWSIGAVTQFRFFRSSNTHNRFGKATIWLTNLPFLAMLVAVYWTEIVVGVRVLRNDGALSPGGVFTAIGWLLILYPVAYVALIKIPFGFTKNTQFIRWVFLTRLYRRFGVWAPRTNAWLEEENKARKITVTEANDSARRRSEIEAENEARTAELRSKYGAR